MGKNTAYSLMLLRLKGASVGDRGTSLAVKSAVVPVGIYRLTVLACVMDA
jgi:hypothetical protein